MTVEVLIFGAGAIGAFYGSRIALNKNVNVSCICRSNYAAVKSDGFTITSPQYGESKWTPTRTFPNPEEARKSNISWDFLVVTTKALPDVTDDSALLTGLVSSSTAIVLIQNGLGVEEPYIKRFPDATVLSGVTIASAAQPKPGHIKHNRWTRINVGPFFPDPDANPSLPANQTRTTRNQHFIDLLVAGGIKDASAYTHAKLQLVRWHKIAINAAMNPSSVLSGGSSNNAMSLDPEMSQHLAGVMNEVLTTAPKVVGVNAFPKEFATAEQILKSTQKNVSKSIPSMQIDWAAGKKMELEVILGNPIRLARAKGFEMPRTQTLYALLKMAQKNRDDKEVGKGSKL